METEFITGAEKPAGQLRTHLRVLYLVPYLALGGTERHLIDLIRTIGWQRPPWVLAPDGPSRPTVEEAGARWLGAPTLGLGRRALAAWRGAFARACNDLAPHLVHVHAGVELLWITRHLAADRPRIFTVHGYHGRGAGTSYRLAARLGGRWARRVIAVSASEARRLVGVPAEKLRVVLNGVADVRRQPLPPPLPGIPEGALVVAVASRLDPPKGVDLVVEAFLRLIREGVTAQGDQGAPAELHLVVMGSGSQEQPLRRRIAQSGAQRWVHLLGHQPQAASLLRRATVVVQASRQDALPLTVAEAMAAGVPAVVSDAGGLPELVEDGVTGRVVPTGDVGSLARALAELLSDPQGRARMGLAARRRYERQFSLARFVADTLQVYHEVADGPDRKP